MFIIANYATVIRPIAARYSNRGSSLFRLQSVFLFFFFSLSVITCTNRSRNAFADTSNADGVMSDPQQPLPESILPGNADELAELLYYCWRLYMIVDSVLERHVRLAASSAARPVGSAVQLDEVQPPVAYTAPILILDEDGPNMVVP